MSVFTTIKAFFTEEEKSIENGVGEIHAVVTNLHNRLVAVEASLKAREELIGVAVTQPSAAVEGAVSALQALSGQQSQNPGA